MRACDVERWSAAAWRQWSAKEGAALGARVVAAELAYAEAVVALETGTRDVAARAAKGEPVEWPSAQAMEDAWEEQLGKWCRLRHTGAAADLAGSRAREEARQIAYVQAALADERAAWNRNAAAARAT